MLLLTDQTGMLQHAAGARPNLSYGYCTDDNARALIVAVKLAHLRGQALASGPTGSAAPGDLLALIQRYLGFLGDALNPETRRFRNFMSYDRAWLEETGSQDSHARAVWAVGTAVQLGPGAQVQEAADQMMRKILPATEDLHHIRSWAYSLLGIDEYLRSRGDHELARRLQRDLAERLFKTYREHSTRDWPWWEDALTWGNAKLPHAMLVSGWALERDDMVRSALTAMQWLLKVQTGESGQLTIIGNQGWFVRGGVQARFDQQPIEAKGLVQACLTAATITGEKQWAGQARRCFEWFTGRNDLDRPLYNPDTGGCHDGLTPKGVNANQGAESTLAYILSVLELHHYDRLQKAEHSAAQGQCSPRRSPLRGSSEAAGETR